MLNNEERVSLLDKGRQLTATQGIPAIGESWVCRKGGTRDYTDLHRSQRLDCSFPEWFEKALRHPQQALNLIRARAGTEGLDPYALLSSVHRRGLPPLDREERHSLRVIKKRRERLSPLYI